MSVPFNSASMQGPSALAGSVNSMASPNLIGYDIRTISLIIVRVTSASTRKVTVSDQLRTDARKFRPGLVLFSDSTLVNGHGPAMQERRALRNSLPSPASRDTEPIAAFHLPSGEHGP